MKAPICSMCLNSDMLCSGCEQKLQQGKLSQHDIDVSREIFRMSDQNKTLEDITLKKVINADTMILISGKGDAAKLVGKKGIIVKKLADKFGKNIKIMEESGFNDFIKSLVSPAPIIGINVVFGASGEKLKIRIPSDFKDKISVNHKSMSSIIKELYNKEAELVFE